MLIGYARVSTPDHDPGYQLRALKQRGCEKIFTDRCTGKAALRPQLDAAPSFASAAVALADTTRSHHTRQVFSRTIGRAVPHSKAARNSGEFDTTPMTRNSPGECGSLVTCILVNSSVWF